MSIGGSGIGLIGDDNPQGCTFGSSTSKKISFFGVTPVAQQTAVNALTTTTATLSTSAFGFSTAAIGNQIVQDVKDMHTALLNLGILNQ